MTRAAFFLALTFTSALLIGSWARDRFGEDFPEIEKESIQKTLDFPDPAGAKSLNVDNVDGDVHVTGYDGGTIQLDAAKTIRARSKEDIETAKKEVELKISEQNNRIDLYVDGPFRCQDGSRRSRRLFYRVNYDFQIKVPRNCNLDLRTVNNGEIRVEGVNGKYDIDNVNGRIEMNEVSGSGRAYAVNGGVKVLFSRNPSGDCSFGSLNGNVDVAFRPDFSADCWFKTFNGGAYTDFEIRPLPQPVAEPERRNGMFVYKSNTFFGGRIGNGGPQIKFDAFNGNIHVTAR